MSAAQLVLVEELSLDRVRDSAPSGPAGKFAGISSLPIAMVIVALLQGPQPVARLQRIAGDEPDATLLDDLRQLGLELACREVPIPDSDGELCCLVCALTLADSKRIARWLKTSGGCHG